MDREAAWSDMLDDMSWELHSASVDGRVDVACAEGEASSWTPSAGPGSKGSGSNLEDHPGQ